jgi:hypothetical protein
MHGRHTGTLTGHRGDQIFGIVEPGAAAGQAFERVAARRQQLQRGPVRGDIDAERAENP